MKVTKYKNIYSTAQIKLHRKGIKITYSHLLT